MSDRDFSFLPFPFDGVAQYIWDVSVAAHDLALHYLLGGIE